jgi:hypothetical protein
MKVVLGGSRHLSFLPDEALDSLASWMREGASFYVGDASGTDSKFQEFLLHRRYAHVTVFFSGDFVRHNAGSWPTERVESGLKSKGHALHTAKDRVMTAEVDTGLMIWDTASPGTIANVIDLLVKGKPCQLFVAGLDANLYHLHTIDELATLEGRYPEIFEEATKRLAAHAKRTSKPNSGAQETLF